jgi:hypothetical protein
MFISVSKYVKKYTDFYNLLEILPITVAVRSKAWILFARLKAGILGSNPTQRMDVCVRLFCV